MANKTFLIPTMTCQGCVKTIQKLAEKFEAVSIVAADVSSHEVNISWSDENQLKSYLENLDKAGYTAK